MSKLKDLLAAWLGVTAAIAVTVAVLPGIDIDWHPLSYGLLAALWGLLNITLGTFVRVVSTPLRIITLGLFSLVINAIVLVTTAAISDSLSVDGFGAAIGASIVISLVNAGFMAIYHRRSPATGE